MNDLEPLKIVDALQHIKGLQMDTQTLKGNVNILSMTQIARGQDFLALYNDTLSFKLNFTKYIEKQSRIFNETMVQILHKFQTGKCYKNVDGNPSKIKVLCYYKIVIIHIYAG